MKNNKLLNITVLSVLFTFVFSLFVNVYAADIEKGIMSAGNIYVSGVLKDGVKASSVIAVKKGAGLNPAPSEILYLNELRFKNGKFEFKFKTDCPADGMDIYVYNGEKQAVLLKDYADSLYVSVDMDVKTYIESVKYDINLTIQNVFGYDLGNCNVYTAVYNKDGAIENIYLKDIYLSSADTSEIKNTIPLDNIAKNASRIKLFIWNNMKPVTKEYTAADNFNEENIKTITSDGLIPYNDSIFYISGRWYEDAQKGALISNWTRPYIRVKFAYKQGQIIKFKFLRQSAAVNIYVNGEHKRLLNLSHTWYRDANEDEKYSFVYIQDLLSEGMNEVTFIIDAESVQTEFYGLKVVNTGDGMPFYEIGEKPLKMMFIGDSITSAANSYSRLTPMNLNADFVTVSRSGIALRDGKSYFSPSGGNIVGMQSRFNYYESVGGNYMPNGNNLFDFNDNYDIIFINLGTNDRLTASQTLTQDQISNNEDFKKAYIEFLNTVKQKYSQSQIVAIKPLKGGNNATADRKRENANRGELFDEMYKNGALNIDGVHYCDTSDWNVEYLADELHPSDNGHMAITQLLTDYLKSEGLI